MAFTFLDDDRASALQEREECRAILADHRNLQSIVSALAHEASQGSMDHNGLIESLSSMQGSVEGVDRYLRKWTASEMYPNYCPPHASKLAQTVFDVPELLEMFLACLTMDELLAAQLINRQFRDALDSSIKLQRKLSLLPHSSPDFFAPFDEDEAPGFNLDGYVGQEQQIVTNAVLAEASSLLDNDPQLPKVGATCRKMLLCHPPVTQMRAFPDCCDGDYPTIKDGEHIKYLSIELVQNPSGITIGDLLDAATNIKEMHRNCPYASAWQMNVETGEVNVQTVFQTWYRIGFEDPMLKARWASKREHLAEVSAENRRVDIVDAFGAEKRRGKVWPAHVSRAER